MERSNTQPLHRKAIAVVMSLVMAFTLMPLPGYAGQAHANGSSLASGVITAQDGEEGGGTGEGAGGSGTSGSPAASEVDDFYDIHFQDYVKTVLYDGKAWDAARLPVVVTKKEGANAPDIDTQTVVYSNHTEVGTATAAVTITTKGVTPVIYKKDLTFTIANAELANYATRLVFADSHATEYTAVYNGKPHMPTFESIEYFDASKGYYIPSTLKVGTDFEYEYKNNVEAGVGTVTLKGLKGYSSSEVSRSFTINPANLADIDYTDVTIGGKTSRDYEAVQQFAIKALPAIVVKLKGNDVEIPSSKYRVTWRHSDSSIGEFTSANAEKAFATTGTITATISGNDSGDFETGTGKDRVLTMKVSGIQASVTPQGGTEKFYPKFADALEAAKTGKSTINVLTNVSDLDPSGITIPEGADITLNLGASTLVATITNKGLLTVTGTTGTLDGSIVNEGTLAVSGGTITGTVANTSGTTTITGGVFTGTTPVTRTAGTVNIQDGNFTNGDAAGLVPTGTGILYPVGKALVKRGTETAFTVQSSLAAYRLVFSPESAPYQANRQATFEVTYQAIPGIGSADANVPSSANVDLTYAWTDSEGSHSGQTAMPNPSPAATYAVTAAGRADTPFAGTFQTGEFNVGKLSLLDERVGVKAYFIEDGGSSLVTSVPYTGSSHSATLVRLEITNGDVTDVYDNTIDSLPSVSDAFEVAEPEQDIIGVTDGGYAFTVTPMSASSYSGSRAVYLDVTPFNLSTPGLAITAELEPQVVNPDVGQPADIIFNRLSVSGIPIESEDVRAVSADRDGSAFNPNSITEPGTYTVIFEGRGNFKGSLTAQLEVIEAIAAVYDGDTVTSYETLSGAIGGASTGSALKLVKSTGAVEVDDALSLNTGLTFDLNGRQLCFTDDGQLSLSGEITLKNGSVEARQSLSQKICEEGVISASSEVSITGVSFSDNSSNGAVFLNTVSGARVTLMAGNNVASRRSAILSSGALSITGGSYAGAPALSVDGSEATVSGGSFVGSADQAAKVTGGSLVIAGGTFSGPSAIAVDSPGRLTISGGTFEGTGAAALVANGGTLNVTKGDFKGDISARLVYPGVSCDINGGTYEGAVSIEMGEGAADDDVIDSGILISGGSFIGRVSCATHIKHVLAGGEYSGNEPSFFTVDQKNENSDEVVSYGVLAEGCKLIDSSIPYKVVPAAFVENAKASVSLDGVATTYYENFDDAMEAALEAQYGNKPATAVSILLLDTTELSHTVLNTYKEQIPVIQTFTLDLNGHNLDAPAGAFIVTSGGSLTIQDSSDGEEGVLSASGNVISCNAGTLTVKGGEVISSGESTVSLSGASTLAVEAGAIGNNSNGAAVAMTGAVGGSDVTITGGRLSSSGYPAISMESSGSTLRVEGGSISGPTGVELRAGTLTASGGTIAGSMDSSFSSRSTNDGDAALGAGIAVVRSSLSDDVGVSVSGSARVSGYHALHQIELDGLATAVEQGDITFALSGGTFYGAEGADPVKVLGAGIAPFITGGEYSRIVDDAYLVKDPRYVVTGYDSASGLYEVGRANVVAKPSAADVLIEESGFTDSASFTYSGLEQTAFETDGLEGYEFVATGSTLSATDVGTYQVKYKPSMGYVWGDDASQDPVVLEWRIIGKDLGDDDVDITLGQASYPYDGIAHEPVVSVAIGDTALSKVSDSASSGYKVSYLRNGIATDDLTNVGTVTVKIEGQGNYAGTNTTKSFAITAAVIDSISLNKYFDYYMGSDLAKSIVATVSSAGAVVDSGEYGLSYVRKGSDDPVTKIDAVGIYEISVDAKVGGNYKVKDGGVKTTFEVLVSPLSDKKIRFGEGEDSFVYDRKAHRPTISVYVDEKKLDEGEYTVKIFEGSVTAENPDIVEDPINVGTYTVEVSGKAGSEAASSLPAYETFEIVAHDVDDTTGVKVVGEGESFRYRGEAVTPIELELVVGGETIKVSETEYEVSYVNNTNAGTATAIIRGKNNFTGVRTATFTIDKKPVRRSDAVTVNDKLVYNGAAQDGVVLNDGVAWASLSGQTSGVNVGSYKATVTLDANHRWESGDSGEVSWSIVGNTLAIADLPASVKYSGGSDVTPAFKVVDSRNVEVDSWRYHVAYTLDGKAVSSVAEVGTYTVTVTPIDTGYTAGAQATKSFAVTNGTGGDAGTGSGSGSGSGSGTGSGTGTGTDSGVTKVSIPLGYQNLVANGQAQVVVAGGAGYKLEYYSGAAVTIDSAGNAFVVEAGEGLVRATLTDTKKYQWSNGLTEVYTVPWKVAAAPNTDPETPAKPDQPDQPNQPDQPSKPDAPDQPNQPGNPNTPVKPDTPDQPNTPDGPSGLKDGEPTITLGGTAFVYSGSPIMPTVTVSNPAGVRLAQGTDYTVSYRDNVNHGVGVVVVTYAGIAYTRTFSIASAPITAASGVVSQVYSGKPTSPGVDVYAGARKLVDGVDYTRSYSGNTAVGTAKVTVTGTGNYSGTVVRQYQILPKATKVKKLAKGKKRFKVTWGKQATQTSGYQIQYSTSKLFTASARTVTVSKNSTVSKTVKVPRSNERYYVRVRTFKQVSGQKYYSSWSAAKSVKTR